MREQSDSTVAHGRIWPITMIVAVSVTLAAITSFRSECLPFDAFGFIRYAREVQSTDLYRPSQQAFSFTRESLLERSPFLSLVASRAQHPGHSLMILGVHQSLVPFFPDDETMLWAASARGVSILSFGCLVLFSYWLYRSVFGEVAALFGAAILGVSPAMVRVGSDALSDGPSAALMVLSALFFCKFLTFSKARFALAGAVVAGVAYWIRPEAIQLALLMAGFLAVRFILGKSSRLSTLWALTLVVATVGALTAPYMALRQSPLTKKAHTVELMLGSANGAATQRAPIASPTPSSATPATAVSVDVVAKPEFKYLDGLGYFFLRWTVLSGFVFLPLIVLGIIVQGRRLLEPDRLFLTLAVLANLLGLPMVLYVLTGYLDIRHTVPTLVLSAGFAWSGLLATTIAIRTGLSWLKEKWTGSAIRWPVSASFAAVAAGALFFAAMAGYAICVRSNSGVSGYRQAGLWLAEQVPKGEAVLDPAFAATFYAELDEQNPWVDHGVFRFAGIASLLQKHPQVRWLVVSDRLVREREGGRAIPMSMGKVTLSEAFTCPISLNPGGFDFVRVYHVDDAVADRAEPPK